MSHAVASASNHGLTFGSWTGFFAVMAGASVTLFSVMFVTLQVRPTLWNGSPVERAIATSALGELIIPLFFSVISLMPSHPWRVAAALTGLFGLCVVGSHWRIYLRSSASRYEGQQAATGAFSFGLYSVIIACAFLSFHWVIYLVGGTCTWLLFSGATEAWMLLVLGKNRQESPEAAPRDAHPAASTGGSAPDPSRLPPIPANAYGQRQVFDLLVHASGAGLPVSALANQTGMTKDNVAEKLKKLSKLHRVEAIPGTAPTLWRLTEAAMRECEISPGTSEPSFRHIQPDQRGEPPLPSAS